LKTEIFTCSTISKNKENLKTAEEESKIRIWTRTIMQWYGSVDPDPNQNITDPEHKIKNLAQTVELRLVYGNNVVKT
jgi:hypothetical protein